MTDAASMEHRWGIRITTDFEVRLIALPSTVGFGRMVNVSLTGAFVRTTVILAPPSLVYVEPVCVPIAECPIGRIAACVVRCGVSGIGLEWCDFATEAVDRLMRAGRGEVSTVSARERASSATKSSRMVTRLKTIYRATTT